MENPHLKDERARRSRPRPAQRKTCPLGGPRYKRVNSRPLRTVRHRPARDPILRRRCQRPATTPIPHSLGMRRSRRSTRAGAASAFAWLPKACRHGRYCSWLHSHFNSADHPGRSGASPAPSGAAGDPSDHGADEGGASPLAATSARPSMGWADVPSLRSSAKTVVDRPEGVDPAAHRSRAARRQAGDLVTNGVVPEAPQAPALASRSATDLATTFVVGGVRRGRSCAFADGTFQRRSCLGHAVLA